MKNYFILLFFSVAACYSQETEFKFNKDGITDFIVIEIKGKSQSDLYKKTVDWISVNFSNPNEAIKSKIENEYIRLEGFTNKLLCFNTFGKQFYESNYQIEISFKEGRYKFDVIEVNLLGTKSEPKIELTDTKEYYKKDGRIKSNYKYFPDIFPKYFNDLNSDLKKFIENDSIPSKKGDW